MRRKFNILYIVTCLLCVYTTPVFCHTPSKDCVILLHGLARSHYCMAKLASMLKRSHYAVVNGDYPSTTKSIKTLAEFYLPPMIAACQKINPHSIHFVTHSMGGILLQYYLQNHRIAHLGRIVMLSPPNHGSQVADLLHNNWLFKWITGPAGQELTTSQNSTPNQIHLKQPYQIGIIAGTFNFVPFGYYLFNDDNDGAVSVSSAKSHIMKDFISFPVSHPFIMDNTAIHQQILYFLRVGKFKHHLA